MSIQKHFEQIISKQKQMGYHLPAALQSPASIKQIEETEKAIDMKFNDELLQLYTCANGTSYDYDENLGTPAFIPIHTFLSLSNAIEYYNVQIDFEWSFVNHDTEYSPGKKLFPFMEDGAGNCYWVDLNDGTENYGKIFWTNTFGDQPDYRFHSLTSMFEVISLSYAKGIMKVRSDGYLECDYEAFEELRNRLNPNTP